MITILDDPAVSSAQWPDLADELNRWSAEGRIATLWWRDDDAAAPSGWLDNLFTVADQVPISLAVIPAMVEPALARSLEGCGSPRVCVLQHGWRHANHAITGKKSEFPFSRSKQAVARDLALGRERLSELFGKRALPVLAPPWNRFDDMFLFLLSENEILGISRLNPRARAEPQPGLFEANVHVDLVDWRGERRFIGTAMALRGLISHLRARRSGRVDPTEPTGILTHHLVQDEETRLFLGELVELTSRHPAVRWLAADEIFAPAAAIGGSGGRA